MSFPTPRNRPGLRRYLSWNWRALSTSLLNQAVSSGTSFLLGFVLVRALTPAEFGFYGLGLAACYLYASIGNAAVLAHMVAQTAERPEHERPHYMARLFVGTVALCAVTLALAGTASLVLAVTPGFAPDGAAGTLSVAMAAVAFLLKDYFVRQAYVVRAEARALAINLSVAVSLVALLAFVFVRGSDLGAKSALLVFAAAQAFGALVGLRGARLPLRTVSFAGVRGELAASWKYSRWALAGVPVTWTQTQAYAFATATFAGADGVGRANAGRLLVSPFLFLLPALNQVTTPRLAELRVRDPGAAIRMGMAITSGMLAAAFVYSLALVAGANVFVPLLLGPRYEAMTGLAAAWCAVLVGTVIRDGAYSVLQATKRFRAITSSNAVSAAVTVVSVGGLAVAWGPTGAVLGTAVGELVYALLLWRAVLTPTHAPAVTSRTSAQ